MKLVAMALRFETPCFGLPASFSQNAHLKSGPILLVCGWRADHKLVNPDHAHKPAGELPNNDAGMNEAA